MAKSDLEHAVNVLLATVHTLIEDLQESGVHLSSDTELNDVYIQNILEEL
jgi:hypothetical protein